MGEKSISLEKYIRKCYCDEFSFISGPTSWRDMMSLIYAKIFPCGLCIQAFTHLENIDVKYKDFGIKSASLAINRAGWPAFLMLNFLYPRSGNIDWQDHQGCEVSVCMAPGRLPVGLWVFSEWSKSIRMSDAHNQHWQQQTLLH